MCGPRPPVQLDDRAAYPWPCVRRLAVDRDEGVVEVDELAHEISGDRLVRVRFKGLGLGSVSGLGLGFGFGFGSGDLAEMAWPLKAM